MKILLIVLLSAASLFVIESGLFAIESRLRDGVPEFAVAKVNGVVCWTKKDRDDLKSSFDKFSSTSPVIVEDLMIDDTELAIATSGLKFDNYTDYSNCVNDPNALNNKIIDLKPSKAKELQPSLDYLKSKASK